MRPSVSWLLPVRDGAAWLGPAVASALAECGGDDEVVVVDDGSEDDPAVVLPADRRIVLIRQDRRGLVAALEAGRAACRHPLLAQLDADDVALPGRIDAQSAALRHDPGLAAVGGRARIWRPDGPVPEGMARYVRWVNSLCEPAAVAREALVESPIFHPAATLRAEAVASVGGWRHGDLPEDYDLWLRLLGSGWRLTNVPRDVVLLADRPDRLTRTHSRYRREAFLSCKQDYVRDHLLPGRARVAVWGAGRTGRPWVRWLGAQGAAPVAVVDLRAGGRRQGVPVVPIDAVEHLDVDLLLVAVGARGAREQIRAMLAVLRPDLVEGRDWFAVA